MYVYLDMLMGGYDLWGEGNGKSPIPDRYTDLGG